MTISVHSGFSSRIQTSAPKNAPRFGEFLPSAYMINEERLERDFVKLATIPSPSGKEGEIYQHLIKKLCNSSNLGEEDTLGINQGIPANIRKNITYHPQPTTLPLDVPSAPYSPNPYFLVEPNRQSIYIYVPGSSRDMPVILWATHMDTVKVSDRLETIPIDKRRKTGQELYQWYKAEDKRKYISPLPLDPWSSGLWPSTDTIYTSGKDLSTGIKPVLGADAKTSIASSFEFIRKIQNSYRKRNIPFAASIIAITTGEELGLLGAQATEINYMRYADKDPSLIVAMDSAGFPNKIILSAPGLVTLNGYMQGVRTNSSNNPQPGVGANALIPMAQFVGQFPVGYIGPKDAMRDIIANIGTLDTNTDKKTGVIEGGILNAYPDIVDIKGDIRARAKFPDAANKLAEHEEKIFDATIKNYNRLLDRRYELLENPEDEKKSKKPVAHVKGKLTITPAGTGYETNPNHAVLLLLKKILNDEGMRPFETSTLGASDANEFAKKFRDRNRREGRPEHAIPVIEIGSGYFGHHTTDEAASLQAMKALTVLQLKMTQALGEAATSSEWEKYKTSATNDLKQYSISPFKLPVPNKPLTGVGWEKNNS